MTAGFAGIAGLSASWKAMDFWIDPVLYMAPLARGMDRLEGRAMIGGGVCGEMIVADPLLFEIQ